jgi:hypothetical protein
MTVIRARPYNFRHGVASQMSPFDSKLADWEESVARYRKFSALLGEDEKTAPLRRLASEMERHLLERRDLRAGHAELTRLRHVLLAEIDMVLAWTRSHLLRPPGLSAENLRQASRLCREEARAAEDMATRRAFAARALDFAMLGEQLTRRSDTSERPSGP